MGEIMKTLGEYFKRDSAYWGERREWLVAYTLTRDGDALARSNFRCFLKLLGGKGTEGVKGSQEVVEGVAIEEANHWACGWIQYLMIDPARADLVAIAEKALERLDGYPVLDEMDWSLEESEEAEQVWRNCYRERERLEYIRKHRSQFEFRGFSDLLGCVRGKYFAGYASELLH